MNPVAIIEKKRNGKVLDADEVGFFINNYLQGSIPDYQVSALLMSIYFRGMNAEETYALTCAMLSSGRGGMDLSKIKGSKIAKHSTGGVGDKLSLIVVPLLASLGVTVFKMSGRGLGHTGGTLDKLESIPGFCTSLNGSQILSSLVDARALIVEAGKDLCPADRKLYALRDVTATVDSLPLIVSSIMSKKLSEDFDGLVLDVKVGSGAFLKTLEKARELAEALVETGRRSGKKVTAVMTDMNWPLGNSVGNAIEVNECVDFMKSPILEGRLYEAVSLIGGKMYEMAGMSGNSRRVIRDALQSGRVYEKFLQMVDVQGGKVAVLREGLPLAPICLEATACRSGHVQSMNASCVGTILNDMGGGRKQVGDSIDHGVGMEFCVRPGEAVEDGAVLAKVFARDREVGERARKSLETSIRIGDKKSETPPLCRGIFST